ISALMQLVACGERSAGCTVDAGLLPEIALPGQVIVIRPEHLLAEQLRHERRDAGILTRGLAPGPARDFFVERDRHIAQFPRHYTNLVLHDIRVNAKSGSTESGGGE